MRKQELNFDDDLLYSDEEYDDDVFGDLFTRTDPHEILLCKKTLFAEGILVLVTR